MTQALMRKSPVRPSPHPLSSQPWPLGSFSKLLPVLWTVAVSEELCPNRPSPWLPAAGQRLSNLPQRVHPHLTHSVSPGVTIQTVTRTCSFNSHACETMSNHLGLGFSFGQCDRNSSARLFQECVVHNAFYPAMRFHTFNIPRRKRDASEWTVYA